MVMLRIRVELAGVGGSVGLIVCVSGCGCKVGGLVGGVSCI